MKHRFQKFIALAALFLVMPSITMGALTTEEASKLGITGTPLTPFGAIRAANADGSIPSWQGGLAPVARDAARNDQDRYIDPFADDAPLFSITASNYEQYAEHLTEGEKQMFKLYPETYKMHIYPTRRSASFPVRVYEATLETAKTAELCGERCIKNTAAGGGIPFPIPANGLEAMWNRSLFYYGDHFRLNGHGILVAENGTYRLTDRSVNWNSYYYTPAEQRPTDDYFTRQGGAVTCFYEVNISPPRTAGQLAAGCMYQQNIDADAYMYIPGQRRVRKAPDFGFYDQPAPSSDGLITMDARGAYMLTGDEEWYDYTLLGTKEIFIPYNSYKLAAHTDFDEIVKPHHINSDLVRYELHRVWVVEAKLRPNFRHISPHRFAYFDEDSWAGALSDMYDAQGRLWRHSQEFLVNYYDALATDYWGSAHYDLITGRYASVTGWGNREFDKPFDWNLATPQGLRKAGVR
nr:E413 [uncultured bacterium]